jgi:hypothetical protein
MKSPLTYYIGLGSANTSTKDGTYCHVEPSKSTQSVLANPYLAHALSKLEDCSYFGPRRCDTPRNDFLFLLGHRIQPVESIKTHSPRHNR